MKILVTGSVGFIGRKLCSKLRQLQHEVVELDILPNDGIQADIRDARAMKKVAGALKDEGGIDACVHLAAIAAPRKAESDPRTAWDTNVTGTHNVLTLCQAAGAKKVVFTSSAHVYGISPKYMPTDERAPLVPLDTYTTTKILGEQILGLFHDNYGLSYVACRLFNAYGPGQSPDYFIGVKLRQARSGGPVTIMNGEVTKDWVWVYDVVDALVACTATPYVGTLNIGTGSETSLRAIAQRVAEAHGTVVVAEEGSDVGPTRMCADWSRAARVLGWAPRVLFEEGLRLTIASQEQRPSG